LTGYRYLLYNLNQGWCLRMKTSIELSDVLYEKLRRCAKNRHLTIRELLEKGIELVIQNHSSQKNEPFFLKKDFCYGSGGLTKEALKLSWTEIHEMTSREFIK